MYASTYLRIASVTALVLSTIHQAGATQGALELPPILRDMPRSGSMCKNDRLPDLDAPGEGIAARRVQAACVLAISEIADFLQKQDAIVIDSRKESEFAQFHIANAMRVDVPALRTREHMRNKAILLVGDGKADRDLYAICSQMRSRGFRSVQVLAGGMAGYLAKELPVNGQPPPSVSELAQIDAAQVWAQSQFSESMVVAAHSLGVAGLLPNAEQISTVTPASVATAVERRRKKRGKWVANVVLAVDTPFDEATFKKYSHAVAPAPLLIYTGGASKLKAFLDSQQTVWRNHQRGPKQPRCG